MTSPTDQPRLQAAIILVASLYAGVLLGCSFLATSVKFLAPTLTLPVALDVGRQTFQALLIVEWVLVVPLLALTWFGCGLRARATVIAVILILLAETFWLRPILDARVARIVAGQPVPPSIHHLVYGTCELAKVLLLLSLAGAVAWRRPPQTG